jgi:hypothetical protein
MGDRLYRFARLAALAFWMGGFTFYALVVIPAGNRLLGSIEQGLVTQHVTQWMNLSGVLALAILLPSVRRTRWLAGTWFVMAAALAMLFALHPRLDSLIDGSQRAVTDETRFYRWHQAYLAAVTIQWSAAVVHLWSMTADVAALKTNDQGPAAARSGAPR